MAIIYELLRFLSLLLITLLRAGIKCLALRENCTYEGHIRHNSDVQQPPMCHNKCVLVLDAQPVIFLLLAYTPFGNSLRRLRHNSASAFTIRPSPVLTYVRTYAFALLDRQRRRLAAYCSCRESHQPEKLFPDQISQRPNIDR